MTLSPVLRTLGLGVGIVALSLSAGHAAEPHLVSASPGPKEGYGPWPKQIRMTFDQPIAQSGLQVNLLDPDGRRIGLAAPVRSGNAMVLSTTLRDPPVPGPYMLSWQARSTSGEEGKGDFTFFVQ